MPAVPPILLVLALLLPLPAAALTLPEAVEEALARNESPGIAAARVEQARAQRRLAIARLLPQVSAQGSWSLRPRITRQLGAEEVEVQSRSALGSSVTAGTRLFDAAAIPLITATGRDARAEEEAARNVRRVLTFDVAVTYVSVLATEAVLEAADRRVAVAEEAAAVARERLEAGLTNRNDLTRTELALSEARLARTDAIQAVQLARIALGWLVARQVDEPLQPVVVQAPGPDRPAAELFTEARLRRPDLLELELRTSAADARDDEPLLRLVPSLDLQGAWRITDDPGFSGRETDWSLALAATWQIYDGGVRYADRRLLAAQTRALGLQTRALGRQVEREIAEALTGLARAQVAAEEAAFRARVAEQNEEEVVLRFQAGLATALEQADAIAQRFQADAEAAREALQVQVERLALRQALGLWPLDDEERR